MPTTEGGAEVYGMLFHHSFIKELSKYVSTLMSLDSPEFHEMGFFQPCFFPRPEKVERWGTFLTALPSRPPRKEISIEDKVFQMQEPLH